MNLSTAERPAAEAALETDDDLLRLSITICLNDDAKLTARKIDVLEAIALEGSISAASRKLGLSFARAWTVIQELDGMLGRSVLYLEIGGRRGGGAVLSPAGRALVDLYRRIEKSSFSICADDLKGLHSLISAGAHKDHES